MRGSNFNATQPNLETNSSKASQAALKLQEAAIQWGEAAVAAAKMAKVGSLGAGWSALSKHRDTMIARANTAQREAEALLGCQIGL